MAELTSRMGMVVAVFVSTSGLITCGDEICTIDDKP